MYRGHTERYLKTEIMVEIHLKCVSLGMCKANTTLPSLRYHKSGLEFPIFVTKLHYSGTTIQRM